MTINKFISQLVKIECIESSNEYGHYPFQLYAELETGATELSSLALGGDVEACYKKFTHYVVKLNAKQVFMSLDFPAGGDISTDFVVIFAWTLGKLSAVAIPYTAEGDVLAPVSESSHLKSVASELMDTINLT